MVILADANQLVEKAVKDKTLGKDKDKSFVQAFAKLSDDLLSLVTFCVSIAALHYITLSKTKRVQPGYDVIRKSRRPGV